MGDFAKLRERVETNGDVLTVRMDELRDTLGYRKLGVNVAAEISRKLAAEGLGHTPPELPLDSWADVRIFRLGTQIALIISAVENPGTSGDNQLRELASNEAVTLLEEIRKMVCE